LFFNISYIFGCRWVQISTPNVTPLFQEKSPKNLSVSSFHNLALSMRDSLQWKTFLRVGWSWTENKSMLKIVNFWVLAEIRRIGGGGVVGPVCFWSKDRKLTIGRKDTTPSTLYLPFPPHDKNGGNLQIKYNLWFGKKEGKVTIDDARFACRSCSYLFYWKEEQMFFCPPPPQFPPGESWPVKLTEAFDTWQEQPVYSPQNRQPATPPSPFLHPIWRHKKLDLSQKPFFLIIKS